MRCFVSALPTMFHSLSYRANDSYHLIHLLFITLLKVLKSILFSLFSVAFLLWFCCFCCCCGFCKFSLISQKVQIVGLLQFFSPAILCSVALNLRDVIDPHRCVCRAVCVRQGLWVKCAFHVFGTNFEVIK